MKSLTDILGLRGLERAIAAHRATNAVKKLLTATREADPAKPDFSKLTALERAVAAHRHASKSK
jgi:hypothetical protein